MKTRPLGAVRLCLEELERRLVPSAVLSTSTNWSGYAVTTGRGAASDVAAQWVVPAATGTGTAYSSAWVGIDGFNSPTVEQIGTDSDVVNGTPQYYAWYEMYPSGSVNLPLTIHAGDTISADVSYASSKFTLSITDVTTGKSYTTTQTSTRAQRSSAEWVMEAPSSFFGVLPLANFGKATFSGAHATVGGTTGAIDAGWSGTQLNEINMVSRSGATEDTTSGLTDSGSPTTSSFSVAYASSGSTAPPRPHHFSWWWFAPDQVTSTGTMTPAAASATLNVVGPGALSITSPPAFAALSPASQPVVAASLTAAVSSAPPPSLGQGAPNVAGYRLNTGDSTAGPAVPELLPAPGESGAPAERSAPPSDAGANPISDGKGADMAPEASAALPRTFDTYFIEASRERSGAPEGPAVLSDRAAAGETAAEAAEAAAGVFLALALGGSWRSPAEGTGARPAPAAIALRRTDVAGSSEEQSQLPGAVPRKRPRASGGGPRRRAGGRAVGGNGNGSGRRTNEARQREMVRLRAAGLTFEEIGQVLGVTKQRVGQLLQGGAATKTAVRCRTCHGVVADGLSQVRQRPSPLCPACLGQTPGVHFGERLRTHRLVVGLTQVQLGHQVGVTDLAVSLYERGMRRPRAPIMARLVEVLGAGLIGGA